MAQQEFKYQQILETEVAGVTFEGRQGKLAAMVKMGKYCQLRREPNNKFDANAIAVLGVLSNNTHMKLGYLPAPLAQRMAPLMDAGLPVKIDGYRFVGGGDWSLGMRIAMRF